MNRLILTGATGAIGMALIEKCIQDGVEVITLLRPDSMRNDRIPDNDLVRKIECDMDEIWELALYLGNSGEDLDVPEDWKELLIAASEWSEDDRNKTAFINLAWAGTTGEDRNDTIMQNQNVRYSLDAVELASVLGCGTFIGAGSQAEYGRVEGVLTPDTPVHPENAYGMAKLCAGQMTRLRCNQLGLRHIWVRILSVYGPYDTENSMIISTIRKILRGDVPMLTAGNQKWDYIYSEDAASALIALANAGCDDSMAESVNGKVFCIGSGEARPLKEYIMELRDAINPYAELGLGRIKYGPNQIMWLQADISELKESVGFSINTSFTKGIRKTIEWCRTNQPL